jgi:hypothetical protein
MCSTPPFCAFRSLRSLAAPPRQSEAYAPERDPTRLRGQGRRRRGSAVRTVRNAARVRGRAGLPRRQRWMGTHSWPSRRTLGQQHAPGSPGVIPRAATSSSSGPVWGVTRDAQGVIPNTRPTESPPISRSRPVAIRHSGCGATRLGTAGSTAVRDHGQRRSTGIGERTVDSTCARRDEKQGSAGSPAAANAAASAAPSATAFDPRVSLPRSPPAHRTAPTPPPSRDGDEIGRGS